MELTVDFWDVGQGDCSMVHLPDGKLLIIDTGPPESPLVEWLAARGEQIHGIVLTHNDEDHAGCFQDLLERFPSRFENVFLLLDRNAREKSAQRILTTAIRWSKRQNRGFHDLKVQQDGLLNVYDWDAGREKLAIYSVHPDFTSVAENLLRETAQPNSVSAVLCLDVDGKTEIVWGGDAPMRAIADKCEGKDPEVIVGPHHGGPTDRGLVSYPMQFDRIAPKNVFVSAGTGNRPGHPIKKFVDLHHARGRRVVCSQLVHCDKNRVAARRHVMRHHLEFGMVPPQNPAAVTCRGPMRIEWDPELKEFMHHETHALHLKKVGELHNPYCLGGFAQPQKTDT
jgi:beta-lactamase superfamily II metal-dependent hydrolase